MTHKGHHISSGLQLNSRSSDIGKTKIPCHLPTRTINIKQTKWSCVFLPPLKQSLVTQQLMQAWIKILRKTLVHDCEIYKCEFCNSNSSRHLLHEVCVIRMTQWEHGCCSGESTRLPSAGSITWPAVICGLNLLVLYSALRGFFPEYSGFLVSPKTNIRFYFYLLWFSLILSTPN